MIATSELRHAAATDAHNDIEVAPSQAGDKRPYEIRDGHLRQAPSVDIALEALQDLKEKLKGVPYQSRGYKHDDFDPFIRPRLEGMRAMLAFYTTVVVNASPSCYGKWGASALQAAVSLGGGRYCARQLAKLCRAYIDDRSVLPVNPYGNWNETMLVDEDFVNGVNEYLQTIGKQITAAHLMRYMQCADIKEKHGITRDITERTARRYLFILGYRWTGAKKGQFVDGHEREDVVYYRDATFLPQLRKYQERTQKWDKDNKPEFGPFPDGRRVIIWYHDETIFYAHDRRKVFWQHNDASAKPYAKGEGASLMIADFVSADFGYLVAPDGRSARV
ncbi:hypothetical protein BKA70DRAFT_1113902, partial [Coprinopsis sp. MPI-PUGE-AT-0042]